MLHLMLLMNVYCIFEFIECLHDGVWCLCESHCSRSIYVII